jgi:twinkle protein
MRAVEISAALSAQVESVVRHLLPNGRRVGQEWRVGGIEGEAGKSMGVHMTGEKAGVWLDGASGESGDMIGLWMACRRVDLRTACSEAMEFCGIREDRPEHHAKAYRKPDKAGVQRLNTEHAAWLREARKLPDLSVEAYRLASRGDRLMFPFLRGDELVFAKYRKLPKQFSAEADCEPILFGWQAIDPTARAVVICEGELDAIAWHAYGFPALSVPTGAGAHKWIEGEFDALSVFDTIYLSMDMDLAGQKAIPELCERLGRERVKVVALPAKDANQCLIDGVSPDTITLALRDARTLDPSELCNAANFEDAIWAEYGRTDDGLLLPWAKTHDLIKLRPGELSIWAGVNGHGKSAVVGHVVGHAAMSGTRCCVASMEWRTPLWLARMGRQIAGTSRPSEAFSRHIARQYRDSLWAFDAAGSTKAGHILEVFAYARRRYRIELFVIDNLTKCGFSDDDYAGQKKFVEALADFARASDCHVLVVAHMRKSERGQEHPAGKAGVKGSGGITDMATTVVEVWRNKAREKAVTRAAQAGETLPEKYQPAGGDGMDTMLLVHKQNATGKEPAIRLWFDQDSTQFLGQANHRPRPMVSFSVAAASDRANNPEAARKIAAEV